MAKVDEKLVRKARVEEASGVLVEYIQEHHLDSRGLSWDRMVFDNGMYIDVPGEDRFGLSFDLYIGRSYSARWKNLESGRRGLQVVEGADGFSKPAIAGDSPF
jgi:hypothetical protein